MKTELQQWEIEQRAVWRNLFDPYLVTEPDQTGEALAHCPIHDDKDPSANVNLDSGVWHCFSCNKGGPIDMLYMMLTSRQEEGWVPPWVSGVRTDAPANGDAAEPLPTEEEIEEWHQDLLADEAAMDYLRFTRGLRPDEIRKRSIVMRPDRQSGVRYGFPVYDEGSNLVNVRWYAQRNPVRDIKKRVWSVRGHGKARLYPIDVLLGKVDQVCIVEGEFDALLLNSWGIPTVTSTGGGGPSSKRWRPEWNELFEDKAVFIIPDRDITGMEYAHFVMEHLADHAERIAIVELPFEVQADHGADVSEYLLRDDSDAAIKIESLRAMIRKASREARYRELDKDPTVQKLRKFYRKQDHAKREQRREEILEQFQTPPSTLNLAEELNVVLPPFSFTVDQLHTEDSNSLLHSAMKVGKSTLLMNLMAALADGGVFLGMYPTKQVAGRVAFWNYEVSRVQFNRWMKSSGIKNRDRAALWHLRGYNLDLGVQEIFEVAVEWLVMREVTALIVDPYSRAYGGDENDNSAVGMWLDRLDELKREAGVKDLFISAHHGRGMEERARGAARLEDWADALWGLSRLDNDRYFSADGRDVMVPESKLGFDPESKKLTIVGGSRADERQGSLVESAVAIVKKHPGERTHVQLVDDLIGDGTKAERTEAVSIARDSGLIWLDHSTSPARYRPKGQNQGA